jgi:hypothetical protein
MLKIIEKVIICQFFEGNEKISNMKFTDFFLKDRTGRVICFVWFWPDPKKKDHVKRAQ